jgi:hypothetical protein
LDDLLSSSDFLFIIDNFNCTTNSEKVEIEKIIALHPNARWVIFVQTGQARAPQESKLNSLSGFDEIHIQDLPRRSIRELARRWCEQTGSDSEKTYLTVMNQLRAANLPRTGFIVTLLLWSVYQKQRQRGINEAILLTGLIDVLLGKTDLTGILYREFDPKAREIILQHLSVFLRERDGIANINDVTQFLIDFFKARGLAFAAHDVLDVLINCGILLRVEDDISFKYPCFQNYFVALHLREEKGYLDQVFMRDELADYSDEIDLMSGLHRRNAELIERVSKIVEEITPSEIAEQSLDAFDTVSGVSPRLALNLDKLSDLKKKRLTHNQIDDLMDVADRELYRRRMRPRSTEDSSEPDHDLPKPDKEDSNSPSSETNKRIKYINTLNLLGKVIRNSDFTSLEDKVLASKLYIAGNAKVFIYIYNEAPGMAARMTKDLERRWKERGDKVTSISPDLLAYMMDLIFFFGIQNAICSNFAGESLRNVYNKLLSGGKLSNIGKLFLVTVLIELGGTHWKAPLDAIVSANKKNRIVLDMVVDKIWAMLHSRVTSETERENIALVAYDIERNMGSEKRSKSTIIQRVKLVAENTAKREGN